MGNQIFVGGYAYSNLIILIKALPLKPLPSPYSATPSRGGNVAKAFIKILLGVWGGAPIGFPEGEKPTPPGSGCDPTSLKLDGSKYSNLHKVCNVNNKPQLVPIGRNWARR